MSRNKPLTEDQVTLLEEIDGYYRARLRVDKWTICGDTKIQTWASAYDINKNILEPLRRRGLVESYFPGDKHLIVSEKGLKHIKRIKVFHYTKCDGSEERRNGYGEQCTDEKPCSECIRVAEIKKQMTPEVVAAH